MKFSVIIPLYNKAPYIRIAVHSVLFQTYQDYEIIVIDDGSTDESSDIVELIYRNVDEKVPMNIIHQENSGVSVARNNGVAAAKGDYICFLDADDRWNPYFLEEMSRLIDNYPDAGIYGTSYYIVKNGNNRIAPIALDEGFDSGYIDYIKVYSRFLCMPLTSITVAVKRYVFDEMQGFKPQLKMGEDFDLWLRIALKYKVAFLNKQLAYYNQDVDPKFRGIGHLHKHECHEIYYYSEYERLYPDNAYLKQLLDNKRVYGLMKYYLSGKYRLWAKQELAKVDWSRQPEADRRKYSKSILWLKVYSDFMSCGTWLKQRMKNIFI